MEANVVQWALSGTYDEDKPVLIDAVTPTRYISKRRATELIVGLTGAFKPNATVCIHAANDVHLRQILYPVLVLAVLASDCRWTGTNPANNATELRQHLIGSGATYVVTSREMLDCIQDAVTGLVQPIEILLLTDILVDPPTKMPGDMNGRNRLRTLHDLLSSNDPSTLHSRVQTISVDSVAVLMATSGTTGKPKMAERSHRALVSEARAVDDNESAKPYEVRRLYCTPVYHAFSFPDMVINALRLGHPSYILPRFGYHFAHKISEFNITETLAVPSILLALEKQSTSDLERCNLQSLRMILCAGAPLTPQLGDRFRNLFSVPPRVVQAWGMTECGRIATFMHPESDGTGSVGRAIGDCEIVLSDEQVFMLENGRRAAELLVRGSQLMSRYRDSPAETDMTFTRDRWMKTGDIGYIDDGKVYLVDRAKDIIKVDGWSISSAELEEAVIEVDGVVDAAVIGHGESTDEHPVIFVTTKTSTMSPMALKRHLLGRLSRYKVAKCEVKIISHIPRGANGKILRHVLRSTLASS